MGMSVFKLCDRSDPSPSQPNPHVLASAHVFFHVSGLMSPRITRVLTVTHCTPLAHWRWMTLDTPLT